MVASIKERHTERENIYNRQLNYGKNIKTHITLPWVTYKRYRFNKSYLTTHYTIPQRLVFNKRTYRTNIIIFYIKHLFNYAIASSNYFCNAGNRPDSNTIRGCNASNMLLEILKHDKIWEDNLH